jgi:hypothetical protein
MLIVGIAILESLSREQSTKSWEQSNGMVGQQSAKAIQGMIQNASS